MRAALASWPTFGTVVASPPCVDERRLHVLGVIGVGLHECRLHVFARIRGRLSSRQSGALANLRGGVNLRGRDAGLRRRNLIRLFTRASWLVGRCSLGNAARGTNRPLNSRARSRGSGLCRSLSLRVRCLQDRTV